jgi:UTP--glucose-1-phosphate uridylyltransferase
VKKITKAVIPAAGIGSRMLPITKAQPKEMVPVVHKPVIQYVVEEAYQSGITDILIITGKGKNAIEDHFDRSHLQTESTFLKELEEMLMDLNIFYIRQKELNGLGDAVSYAESFTGDDPFVLLLGDTITIPPCSKQLIDVYNLYSSCIIAIEEVAKDRVSSYGIISGTEIKKGLYEISSLVEKPKIGDAPSNLAILGSYLLVPEIFDCIKMVKPGKNGEIQLTDALNLLCKTTKIFGYLYQGRRFDIGNKADWMKANIELSLVDNEIGEEIREFLRGIHIDKA